MATKDSKFTTPASKLKMKKFVREFVKNPVPAEAYKKSFNPGHRGGNLQKTACDEASQLLMNPLVKKEIARLTKKIGLNEDFVKLEHLKRSSDPKRSEKSQDSNLVKIGEIVGAYKKDERGEGNVLNVMNVLNIINEHNHTIEPSIKEPIEVEAIESVL